MKPEGLLSTSFLAVMVYSAANHRHMTQSVQLYALILLSDDGAECYRTCLHDQCLQGSS